MEKFSKKTLLNYVNGAGLFGAAADSQTVKFAYTENIAKVGTAADGTITFYADKTNKTGIIAVGGDIVSSKILNVTSAAVNNGKDGENLITVTYFDAAAKEAKTTTFEVVDAAAAKAYFEDYFTSSNTIAITNGTADVKVDGQTILIDSVNKYLKTGLNIAYIAEEGTTGATIALRDNSNTVLSSIAVSDIVGDGVLKDSIYHQDTNILELRFGNGKVYNPNDPTTYTKVEVNLQKLIDINDVFIGNDSSVYLKATLDASTVTLDTKMQDPSTASANATGLADAWKVKQYVDSKSSDLSVEITSRNAYIDASVGTGDDNKHIYIEAETADLTYVAGSIATGSDSSLTGTANKLVDNADAATKVGQFVNARIAEEVAKLDASIDSAAGTTFISAGVKEVDGKITEVVVHENIGSITGTAENLTGTAGLIDGADAATAVKTYVDGQINALDASVDSDDTTYTKVGVKQVDGKITDVVVSQTKSTITASASALSATEGIADGQEFATGVKTYVDGRLDASIQALDASITAETTGHDISIYLEEVDGVVTTVGVEHTAATVTYTAAQGETPADLTGSGSFVMGSDIAAIKNYIDAVSGALDSSVTDTDNFVTVKTTQENGALSAQDVTVVTADISAGPGAIDVERDGLVTGATLENAIEGALTWTVLS